MNRNAKLLILAIAIFCFAYPMVLFALRPAGEVVDALFKRDIDLVGGTSLIYRVDRTDEIDNAIAVLRTRIDPLGTRGYNITRSEDKTQIEITMAGSGARATRDSNIRDSQEIETVKSLVTRTGLLVFRVLAQPDEPGVIEFARQRAQGQPLPAGSPYAWVPYRYNSQTHWRDVREFLFGRNTSITREQAMAMHTAGRLVYVIHDEPLDSAATNTVVIDAPLGESPGAADSGALAGEDTLRVIPAVEDVTPAAAPPAARAISAAEQNELPDIEILVRIDQPYVTGADFDTNQIRADTADDGTPSVAFMLRQVSQQKFRELTGPNIGKSLGIVLDGKLQSAPTIQAELSDRGTITGYRTPEERNAVMTVLLSGMLDIRLTLDAQRSIGSELGADNARNGQIAAAISVAIVLLFMGVYYRRAGIIANIALLLNLFIIVLVMHAFGGAWSLPGIAGLVLTIGMSVDANVLIFERIREEMSRGSGIKLALRNGYARAWPAIFDGNLTTFLTAVILFKLGGADIKGFAMVLIIGILSSMFTALLFTRTIFEMLIDRGLLRRLPMFQLIKGSSVPFVRIARVAIIFSVIAVTAGIIASIAIGDEKYAMQFRGGTDVELQFQEAMPVDVVRNRVVELGTHSVVSLTMPQATELANVQDRLRVAAGGLSEAVAAHGRSGAAEARSTDYIVLLADSAAADELRLLFPQATVSPPRSAAAEFGFDSAIVQPVRYAEDPEGVRYRVQVASPHVDLVRNALQRRFDDVLIQTGEMRVTVESRRMRDVDVLQLQGAGRTIRDDYIGYLSAIRADVRLVGEKATAQEMASRLDEYLLRMAPGRAVVPREIQPIQTAGVATSRQVDQFALYIHEPAIRDSSAEAVERLSSEWDAMISEALGRKPALISNVVSARVGAQAWQEALIAIVVSLIVIIAYIWLRFARASYGLAAVMALVHDVSIALGLVLLFSWIGRSVPFIGVMRIDLAMIGAFLTLIGYSLNDTIVVFDRIRENRGKFGDISETVINNSINQTVSRTILTSFTTLVVVIVLYFFGGVQSPIHGFAFVLMVGVIVGTYSSIVVASPMLLWLRRGKRRNPQSGNLTR